MDSPNVKRRGKRRGTVVLVSAVLLLVFCAACFYWGNETIGVNVTEVRLGSLPEQFSGFRIVQLSDLHGKVFGENNDMLINAVKEAAPGIIALTGDVAGSEAQLEALPELAEELARIAPVYYVTGNHEWAASLTREIDDILTARGVTVLHNDYVLLEKDGGRLIVAGIDDPNGPADAKTPRELVSEIRTADPSSPIVLLAHRNDPKYYSGLSVSLVLCGHGHGGVVRLPGIGAVVGPGRQLFPKYSAGLYDIGGGVQMFVSRGLGNNSWEKRIFNRPDMPVIVLTD